MQIVVAAVAGMVHGRAGCIGNTSAPDDTVGQRHGAEDVRQVKQRSRGSGVAIPLLRVPSSQLPHPSEGSPQRHVSQLFNPWYHLSVPRRKWRWAGVSGRVSSLGQEQGSRGSIGQTSAPRVVVSPGQSHVVHQPDGRPRQDIVELQRRAEGGMSTQKLLTISAFPSVLNLEEKHILPNLFHLRPRVSA